MRALPLLMLAACGTPAEDGTPAVTAGGGAQADAPTEYTYDPG